MKKRMLIIAMTLLIAGCESSSTTQPAHYQPADGRNLGPGLQDVSRGDPLFPADLGRGGGGGPR